MFCHNCGADWPEGTRFCGKCGTVLKQSEPIPAPIPESIPEPIPEPVPEPVPAPAPAPAPEPIPKTVPTPTCIYSVEPPKPEKPKKDPKRFIKPLSVLIAITMALSLVLIAASGLKMLTTNITDMGVITWTLDTFGILDLEDEMDKLQQARLEMEEGLREHADALSAADQKANRKMIERLEEYEKENTIPDTINFFDYLVKQSGKLEETQGAEEFVESQGFEIELGMLEQYGTLKTVLIAVLISLYALPALFALLAGLLKNGGLTVTAFIFTAIAQVIFSAFGLLALGLVIYALQFVMCKLLKKIKTA